MTIEWNAQKIENQSVARAPRVRLTFLRRPLLFTREKTESALASVLKVTFLFFYILQWKWPVFFLLEQKVFFLVFNKSCKGKWSIMHVQYFVKVAVMVLCYCYDYTICTVTVTGKSAITLLWDWGDHLFV